MICSAATPGSQIERLMVNQSDLRRPSETPEAIDDTRTAEAFLVIAGSSNTTQSTIIILRMLDDAFDAPILRHAARCLAGEVPKPGPKAIDDTAALLRVEELEQAGLAREAVGIVARTLAPGDPQLQTAIERRLRAKRAEMKRR
jgi:hypothetical protein